MTKIEKIENAQRNQVVRRNHNALRASRVHVMINKVDSQETFDVLLSKCKNQASIIQLCFENQKTQAFTVQTLIERAYYDNDKDALARIIRHVRHDKDSRIVSRARTINSYSAS
jgi:hypothetical protein